MGRALVVVASVWMVGACDGDDGGSSGSRAQMALTGGFSNGGASASPDAGASADGARVVTTDANAERDWRSGGGSLGQGPGGPGDDAAGSADGGSLGQGGGGPGDDAASSADGGSLGQGGGEQPGDDAGGGVEEGGGGTDEGGGSVDDGGGSSDDEGGEEPGDDDGSLDGGSSPGSEHHCSHGGGYKGPKKHGHHGYDDDDDHGYKGSKGDDADDEDDDEFLVAAACPPCMDPSTGSCWKNHGKYVSCVAKATNAAKAAGLISGSEKGLIQKAAAQSEVGKAGWCSDPLCDL